MQTTLRLPFYPQFFLWPNLLLSGLLILAWHRYLSNCEDVDMGSDEMFVEVTNALAVVGFSLEEVDMVFSILASVMHIGHIEFKSNSELAPAAIEVASDHAVQTVGKLLQFDVKQFERALTLAITITRGETIKRQYTVAQALG